MKKTGYFSIVIFFCFSGMLLAQTNFNRGFKVGYEKGYCQDKGISCVSPIPPVAPIPKAGESSESYNDGYNRGFKMGLNASKNSNNDNISFDSSNDIYSGLNMDYTRPPLKYNKTTSSINHELIGQILNEKQEAINRERAYLQSLSKEERVKLFTKRLYSKRKSNLYHKNVKRYLEASKKHKKSSKKFRKQREKSTKEYLNNNLLNLAEIKDGWHETIVNIKVNGESNYVKRTVHFNNGLITKYIGGTGFLSNIKHHSLVSSNTILIKVGYEEHENQEVYVSFIKNKTIKLKEEPTYPTIIKFYTTVRNEGKFFIYLNGNKYSDYYTLSKSFSKNDNIYCDQNKGVVTFLVGRGLFNFYAHNDMSEWQGEINTHNRYCIIKELSK